MDSGGFWYILVDSGGFWLIKAGRVLCWDNMFFEELWRTDFRDRFGTFLMFMVVIVSLIVIVQGIVAVIVMLMIQSVVFVFCRLLYADCWILPCFLIDVFCYILFIFLFYLAALDGWSADRLLD